MSHHPLPGNDEISSSGCMKNFVVMSILFSVNHGSVASCLALVSTEITTTKFVTKGRNREKEE